MYSGFNHTDPLFLHADAVAIQFLFDKLSSPSITTYLLGLGRALEDVASENSLLFYRDPDGVMIAVDLAKCAKVLTQTTEYLSSTEQNVTLNRLTTEISKRFANDLCGIFDYSKDGNPDSIFLVSSSQLGTLCYLLIP
jgi:hypothetical protein